MWPWIRAASTRSTSSGTRTSRGKSPCSSVRVQTADHLPEPTAPRCNALGILSAALIPRYGDANQLRMRRGRPEVLLASTANAPDRASADADRTAERQLLPRLDVEVRKRRR